MRLPPRVSLAFGLLLSAASAQTSFPGLVYATVQVAGAPQDLLLDLQVPAGPGPFPLVVWIHGGGWVGGSRLPLPGALTRLLPRGYAVASIDYRLSGTAIWPAQIQDCKAAIRFLRANAATWGLDPARIGVVGSSAGGHLVAALATMGGVGAVSVGTFTVDLEGTVGAHLGTSSRVQCAVDLFGPTTMLHAHDFPTFDHDAANSPESQLIGGALQQNPEKWTTVDPISFVTPDDAPILAMHGTDDTTVPFHQSHLLVDAVRANGGDISFYQVQDNGHGGPGFSTPEANAAIDAFLDRTLRDLPAVTVGITASDPTAGENGDQGTFVVARSGSTAAPLDVPLALVGTAVPSMDCDPIPQRITIPAGQSSIRVSFVPRDDGLIEGAELATLCVVAADTFRVDPAAASATVTLVDDEVASGVPVVTLVGLDPASTEAAGNPGAVRFVRSGATALPLTVAYEVAGSASSGVDCVALTGTVTIPAGSANALVIVAPIQDQAPEAGELVVIRLAAGSNYALGAVRSAHVVIADDDRAGVLPIVGVLGTEQNLGEPADGGAFTVTRTGATLQPLTVRLAVSGRATSGVDFTALPSTVVIPAGAAWVRVPVSVLDDPQVEGIENLVLSLVADPAYRIGRAALQELWIADDDAPPPPASGVDLAVSPLAVGVVGTATLTGGAPGGFGTVWIGLQPGYLPVAPFGVVLLEPSLAGPFASAILDGNGAAVMPLLMPATAALAGLPCWWQGFATTAASPFGGLSPLLARTLSGAGPY